MKLHQNLSMILCLSTVWIQPTLASISIGSSRIIFPSVENSQSVEINNRSSNQPYLIKVDISDSLLSKSSDGTFIATPALFRIEPGVSNKVRILKKANALPQDHESVFYFNVLAIPASKLGKVADRNNLGGSLQVATGNTIKLFYRPNDLSMMQKEAMGKLQFSKQGNNVRVSNPTPYFISLNQLVIGGKNIKLDVIKSTSMVAPFSDNVYSDIVGTGIAIWKAINDYGGEETFHATVD
ncbi:molecular chaperone [Candidatus Erwinia dacicola]|uniref:Fimbrial chaperone protein n=1 Tax=Candidatus Erwinia dacicola TaxID=252393 RepID=A0A1E7Z3Y7_9GAMM|nr:molecular chaperone [Candidatus Erwinia dacicola]OFC63466.1 fimbrial chaperone protein [Candidatus Erwinia dacicola]